MTTADRRATPGIVASGGRPSYASLFGRPGFPPGSSWGLYGSDDQVGALNDVCGADVVSAAELVHRGQVFSLNWDLTKPDPPLFERGPVHHHHRDDGFGTDDHYDNFYPQASSQWDALSHFRHPDWGYYNGHVHQDLVGLRPVNGIDNWARRGIATRYVLADVARWRAAQHRPLPCDGSEAVSVDDIIATLQDARVVPRLGDILLIRFGWVSWYEALDPLERAALATAGGNMRSVGLGCDERALSWLWDSGFVGVAADCPAVEVFPFDPFASTGTLHGQALALLGMALGELFDLERLSMASAVDRDYIGLLTAAPLHMPGGSGSPANALALR